MTGKFLISYKLMRNFFKDDPEQMVRGENAYTSGHVREMTFSSEVQPAHIKGIVQASMRSNHNYEVQISFHLSEGVKDAHCTCPRGLTECHHMAALLWYARYNISITDTEKQWGVPKGSLEESSTNTIESMYTMKMYKSTSQKVSKEVELRFQKIIGPTNIVGFSWLMKSEPRKDVDTLVPPISDILFSKECLEASSQIGYCIEKFKINAEQIEKIAKATVGQHSNENWLVTRKHRLTASKFGAILKACSRGKYPPSLFKNLLEGYDLNKVLAVQWGKNNEETAKQKFKEMTGISIVETGLWLDKCGYLGASPDGFVGEDAVLEVKCPYRFRNTTIKEAVKDRKYFFYYEDGQACVDSNHPYYHQVQGQMYITNRKKCFFFVWLPNDFDLLLIEKDPNWEPNMEILKQFFVEKFISYILDH